MKLKYKILSIVGCIVLMVSSAYSFGYFLVKHEAHWFCVGSYILSVTGFVASILLLISTLTYIAEG